MPSSPEKRKQYRQQVMADPVRHARELERRRRARLVRRAKKVREESPVATVPVGRPVVTIPKSVLAEVYRAHGLFAPLFALQAA